MKQSFYRAHGKRWLDVLVTVPLVLLLLPVYLVIWLAVRLSIGTPVIFRQARAGWHGEPFTLYKFRTMTMAQDEFGNVLPDAMRVTRLGRWLRMSSLDELPELWNVLRGEMSLVGPRPLLVQYVPRYSPTQARRLEVKPGLTGWVAVNGRNAISWEEKFALDVWYVEHISAGLDLKIMMLTIPGVLRRAGIAAPGQTTMDEFLGNES